MGHMLSRSSVDDKAIQESLEQYKSIKDRLEQTTIDFMNYVDVLQASAQYFEGQSSSSVDPDKKRPPQTEISAMHLMCKTKAYTVGQKRYFLSDFITFINFLSGQVDSLYSKSKATYKASEELLNHLKMSNEMPVMVSHIDNDNKSNIGLMDEIGHLEEQIKVITAENKSLRKENSHLMDLEQAGKGEIEEEMNLLKKEIQDKKTQIENLLTEKSKQKSRENELAEEQKQLEEQLAQATLDMNDLCNKNTEIQSAVENMKTSTEENSQLREQNQEMSITNERIEAQLQSVNETNTDLQNQIQKLQSTIETKTVELIKANEEIETMAEKLNVAETQVKTLKVDILSVEIETKTKKNELRKVEKKVEILQEDLHSANTKVKFTTEKLNKYESQVASLQDDLQIANTKIKIVTEKWKGSENQVASLQNDLQSANKETETVRNNAQSHVETLRSDLLSAYRENETTRKKFEDAKSLVETLRSNLRSAERETKTVTDKLTEVKETVKTLEGNLLSAESKLENKTVQLVAANDTTVKIKNQLAECEMNLSVAFTTIENQKSTLRRLQEESEQRTKTFERKISNMQRDLANSLDRENQLEKIKVDAQSQIKALTKALRTKSEENDKLSTELRELMRKSLVKVKLFCLRRVNFMSDFENDLMAVLKSKIDEENKELKFEQCAGPEDIEADRYPTIVLCFTASRIGTDAANAVQGLNLSSNMALLMIHHKDVHALPQQSSKLVLTGPEFKKLGCISDIAFLKEKGIFHCEINNNSIVKLVSFINKEGVVEKKY